jgi:hypothetical protein
MAPKFNPNADYSAAQFDPNADYSAADSGAADAPGDNAAPAPMDRTAGNYARESAYGVGRGLKNLVQGGYQSVRHPIQTVRDMATQLRTAQGATLQEDKDLQNTYPAGSGVGNAVKRNVATALTFAENAPVIGGMVQRAESGGTKPGSPEAVGAGVEAATTFGAPELIGRGIRLAPRAARGAADAVAGTGPRVTKALVKDTQAANVADAAKVGEDNSIAALKAEATRRAELSKHNADVAKHEAGKAASNTKLQKDLSAQREIATTKQRIADAKSARLAAVETAREEALKVGNEKYDAVKTVMDGVPARDDFYKELTSREIPGSKGQPSILKAMEAKAKSGKPVVYQDLQSDFSTLGNEISKGGLPGDVFDAYSDIHEAIGDEMQRLADSQGEPIDTAKVPRKMVEGKATDEPAYSTDIGKAVYDARAYWRRMKQTFGKTKEMNDAATKAIGGGKDEAQENHIRLLGSFDPQIPQLHSLVQTLEAKAKSLPKPVPERVLMRNVAESRAAPPKLKLTPPEPPKPPAPRKVGPEDVRSAKAEAVANRADTFRNRGGGLASTFLVLDGIRNAFHGNVAAIGEDIGARAAFGAAKQSAARLLENPKVADWLSQATPRDVAQIPADLRGDFPNLVKAAQAKGIKVSPTLLGIAAVGGMPAPRRVTATHPETGHKIAHNGTDWVDAETGASVAQQ